jgi:hypothetical protein
LSASSPSCALSFSTRMNSTDFLQFALCRQRCKPTNAHDVVSD